MALSFHPLFIGGDPTHVTSMYILVSHLEKEFGVHYAMGGVQAMADAMVRVIEDQGGTVLQGVEVDEILTRNGAACWRAHHRGGGDRGRYRRVQRRSRAYLWSPLAPRAARSAGRTSG
jgi:phytoene dehydrogenase-like protein